MYKQTRNIVLLITLLSFLSSGLLAQKSRYFSENTDDFIDELLRFMSKNISRDEEEFLQKFDYDWKNDSVFFSDKKSEIIEICNLLKDRKARPYPDFKLFLETLDAFRANPNKIKYYKPLHSAMVLYLENRKISITKIKDFLETMNLMIQDNIIYKSNYVTWQSSVDDFELIVEDNTVFIRLGLTNLSCYSKKDSINIYETKGTYDPIESLWSGTDGLVTWERAGFSPSEVNAELKEYIINMKKAEYTAENVIFTNTLYFDNALTGTLTDAVRLIKEPSNAIYPQFDSYTKLFEIDNIFSNVNYIGGFSMRGAKLIGTGSVEDKANLFLYNNDTLFMKASSTYFAFTKEKVTGRNTEITIFLERDSIYHPDLLLNYFDEQKELTLQHTDDYTSQGPYFNSYHQLDMNFDQLTWKYGDSYLNFTMSKGATIGKATFESSNFFNMSRFEEIQLRDPEHPLVVLKRYSRSVKSDKFIAMDFAQYMRLPVHAIRKYLMRLSFYGFIFYNFDTDEVTIKNKLDAYLESASGKRDYDVIYMNSVTQAPLENALLNLDNFDLTINGMPQVFISDSQSVNIFPAGNQIVMKRNRSFQFDGTVQAGLFTFWGNNFFFSYDSFKINLQNIDSINMNYITGKKDNFGFDVIGNVESMIEHVTGEVLIDDPYNKSGKENFPQYPIFKSRERSYIYYDDAHIQSGVYNSMDFYFHIYPFEIDSLDNFQSQGLAFDGTFYSADIFPVLDETVKLQEDNSMGFKRSEPDGLPIYKEKGMYYDLIHLSNAGLRGTGTLEYLTGTAHSSDLIFLPDSMNTHAEEFEITKTIEQPQFPSLKAKDVYIHWEPYDDEWYTFQESTPFIIYNDTTTLTGNILLEPTGLTGEGNLDMTRAEMSSKAYTFRADDFDALNADFKLRSNLEGISVETDSIDINIDYIKRRGDFMASKGLSQISYPENKYVSHVDRFSWIMDRQELEFKKLKDNEVDEGQDGILTGATYISTDNDQDSLQFVAPLAIYNYNQNLISAKKVEFFHVADALVYPKEGNVTIEPKGAMRSLVESKILANTDLRFHKFHTANIVVSSSKNYKGNAIYDYIDENEQVQQIYMDEIGVDDSVYTYSKANLIEPDSFKLSPYHEYQGKVNLASRNQFLNFDGHSRIIHNCDSLPPRWLQFTSDINPDSIYIPVGKRMKEINDRFIFAGPMIRSDSIFVYPAFFTVWQNYSDNPIVTANGYLHYDHGSDRYKISSLEKLQDFSLPGNYLSFDRSYCELYGEGQVNLNIQLGQVKLTSIGNVRHDVQNNYLKMNIMLGVDFHLRDDIVGIIAKDIDSIPGNQPLDINTIKIKKGYHELIGVETTDKYFEDLALLGGVDVETPKDLSHTLFFNDVKFEWNSVTRSYQSIGDIGIGNVNGKQINKYVKGFIEINRKRSGDMMDIYLKLDDNNWYYFGYTRGVMQVLSSNKDFIFMVRNLKNKERRPKIKGSKTPYNIIVSTDRKYLMFVRRWQEILEQRNAIEDQ